MATRTRVYNLAPGASKTLNVSRSANGVPYGPGNMPPTKPAWTVVPDLSNGLVTLTPSADGLSCTVVPTSPTDRFNLQVKADYTDFDGHVFTESVILAYGQQMMDSVTIGG
jgi:hypothetical protein